MRRILLAALMMALAACYPGDIATVGDLDIVATFPDKDMNFATVLTFVVPDTIVQLNEGVPGALDLSHAYDDEIVDQVRLRLDDYGFEEVGANDDPDVIVAISAVATDNYGYSFDPGWWGWWDWYPGWGCPGCGWYPPGYITVSDFRAGTLVITMFHEAGATTDSLPLIWLAAFNGLLEGPTAGIQARIDAAIDQAFAQSPYLGAGK